VLVDTSTVDWSCFPALLQELQGCLSELLTKAELLQNQAADCRHGSTVELKLEQVASLQDLEARHGPFDAVVVAAGAAAPCIPEVEDARLPIRTCQVHQSNPLQLHTPRQLEPNFHSLQQGYTVFISPEADTQGSHAGIHNASILHLSISALIP
jgi:hypothetical protein